VLLAPVLVLPLAGCAGSPTYMTSSGSAGSREAALGWTLTIISCAVVALVAVLLVWGLARRRERGTGISEGREGVSWIYYGGVLMPIVVLLFAFTYSTLTLTGLHRPPSEPKVHVEVTGHRWWWEMKYLDDAPDGVFVTANELHIPVGVPVHLDLRSADVIHSFWVPQLAGKTDLAPGSRNSMWIEAKEPGVYLGECAEFCGLQHAHMQFRVVAESPKEYAAWLADQRASARVPQEPAEKRGEQVFVNAPCAGCHTVRGTGAEGKIGPDLTHVGSRLTLGAGMLPNTRGHMAGWIANSQAIKPGNYMPAIYLKPAELRTLVTYLQSLR
jgi:cytochrome c oxidase subunit 2